MPNLPHFDKEADSREQQQQQRQPGKVGTGALEKDGVDGKS